MPTPNQIKQASENILSWLDELNVEKKAGEDPGSLDGASGHPSAKADNGETAATEGERSAENTKDIKETVPTGGVDGTSPESLGAKTIDGGMPNIGLHQSATGEDPSVEEAYGDRKEDPGTSHPAEAGQDKYASWSDAKLEAEFIRLGNEGLADIINGRVVNKQASAAPANPAALAPRQAADAGYALAESLGISKEAAQAGTLDTITSTINEALLAADLVAQRTFAKHAALVKQAEDDEEDDDDDDKGEEKSEGGGEKKSEGGPPTSDVPPPSPAPAGDPMAGGGGDPLAAMAGGGAGGPPPGGPPAPGGDPAAAGGDPAAGGGMDKTQIIQELLSAMQELGISPEELLMAAQSAPPADAGGPPGGGPPGGDPMAGDMAAAKAANLSIAAQAYLHSQTGKWTYSPPKTKEARTTREQMKKYLAEQVKR
jgi:hypothetical protein